MGYISDVDKFAQMGKESILCFAGNLLIQCFSLKDIGVTMARWENQSPWFRKSDEKYYLNRFKTYLKAYKKSHYILPPYRQNFIKILNRTIPNLKESLENATRRGLIERSKWKQPLEEYFEYVRDTLEVS